MHMDGAVEYAVQKKSQHLWHRIWRGVTLQLFLFIVLPIIILALAITFGSLELHHEAMRALVADRSLRAVQSAASNISQEINRRGDLLELLSKNLGQIKTDRLFLARMADELTMFDGGLAVAANDGTIAIAIGGNAIQQLSVSENWATIQSAVDASIPEKAAYLPIQTIDGRLFVPVIVTDVSKNYMLGLFSPEKLLSEGLVDFLEGESAAVIVVDQDYQNLYQYGTLYPLEDVSSHPGTHSALRGAGQTDYYSTANDEIIVTHSPIEPLGWVLMVEESWNDIASPLLRATQNAALVVIPILGLAVLALWFVLRQIVQPLQALEEKTGDLARGNFESIHHTVKGVPEIRHLQDTLINMAIQLKEAQDSLHSYIGAITESVEGERRNLARELHDGTMQLLIALGQYTQYAMLWNQDEKVGKTLDQILKMTETSTKDLRRLVQGLRPIYIEDLGLSTAMEMLTTETKLPEGAQIHFQQEGTERRFDPDVEMALYRIAQEALSNISQHARATNAWLTLRFQPDEVVLDIRDDGQGFTPPTDPIQYARLGHFGLLGLYERSELIKAKLTIRSSPGEGTRILVRMPCETADHLSNKIEV